MSIKIIPMGPSTFIAHKKIKKIKNKNPYQAIKGDFTQLNSIEILTFHLTKGQTS